MTDKQDKVRQGAGILRGKKRTRTSSGPAVVSGPGEGGSRSKSDGLSERLGRTRTPPRASEPAPPSPHPKRRVSGALSSRRGGAPAAPASRSIGRERAIDFAKLDTADDFFSDLEPDGAETAMAPPPRVPAPQPMEPGAMSPPGPRPGGPPVLDVALHDIEELGTLEDADADELLADLDSDAPSSYVEAADDGFFDDLDGAELIATRGAVDPFGEASPFGAVGAGGLTPADGDLAEPMDGFLLTNDPPPPRRPAHTPTPRAMPARASDHSAPTRPKPRRVGPASPPAAPSLPPAVASSPSLRARPSASQSASPPIPGHLAADASQDQIQDLGPYVSASSARVSARSAASGSAHGFDFEGEVRLTRKLAQKIATLEQRLGAMAELGAAPDRGAVPPAARLPVLESDWGLGGLVGQGVASAPAPANRVDLFLRLMIDRGASDFHLHVGSSPMFRQSGSMIPMRYRPTRQHDWVRLMSQITPPGIWKRYKATGDADFAYEIRGLARFRVNLLRQHNGGGAVFRVIPSNIMTLEELGMPPAVAKFAEFNSGLLLVTGPTGSGKSTTLAALIDLINRRNAYHVITIEDPIEFVHPDRRCVVHQREVGTHAFSFSDALEAAMREDPDLILVGEMRDRETMSLALSAAEKGVLVFGTLHTNSATKTMDRIINAFPAGEQPQIRGVLADTLRGVVSQQLLRKKGGGRVAALEILFGSKAMANLIKESKTYQLTSLIQTGSKRGMVTMDDSLHDLVQRGVITPDAGLEKAIDKEQFRVLVQRQLAS